MNGQGLGVQPKKWYIIKTTEFHRKNFTIYMDNGEKRKKVFTLLLPASENYKLDVDVFV